MSFGIRKLERAIKAAIRQIEAIMTKDFKNSLQAALNSIGNPGGNPLIAQAIESFKNICSDKNIDTATDFIRSCADAIKKIDPAIVNEFFTGISSLIKTVEEENMIGNINKLVDKFIDSGPTLDRLMKMTESLINPAKLALYGIGGFYLSSAIINAVNCFLNAKKDGDFDKLITGQIEQTYIQLQSLKMQAFQTLLKYQKNLDKIEKMTDHEGKRLFEVAANDAKKILRSIRPISLLDEVALTTISSNISRKLDIIYSAKVSRDEIQYILDRITRVFDAEKAFGYIHDKNVKTLGSPEKFEFDRSKLNYQTCKSLYDLEANSSIIGEIKDGLVRYYHNNGVDTLYVETANVLGKSSYLFMRFMHDVIAKKNFEELKSSDLVNMLGSINNVRKAFDEAPGIVLKEWSEKKAKVGGVDISLPIEVCEIISNRAIMECFSNNVAYFHYLWSMPRDLMNGVVDVPRGMYQLFRHPITSLSGVANMAVDLAYLPVGLMRGKGVENNSFVGGVMALADSAVNHPFRLMTSSLVSSGCSYAISATYSSLTKVEDFAKARSVLNGPTSMAVKVGETAKIGLKVENLRVATFGKLGEIGKARTLIVGARGIAVKVGDAAVVASVKNIGIGAVNALKNVDSSLGKCYIEDNGETSSDGAEQGVTNCNSFFASATKEEIEIMIPADLTLASLLVAFDEFRIELDQCFDKLDGNDERSFGSKCQL
jgi:hypothetical protein